MSVQLKTLLKVSLVVCLLVYSCSCQLNFSTGWGKRGLASAVAGGSSPGSPSAPSNGANPICKASVESLMMIYKLIQNEAQKLIECDKFSY